MSTTGTVTPDSGISVKSVMILRELCSLGLAPHNGFKSGTLTLTFSEGYISSLVYTDTKDRGNFAWNPSVAVIT